MSGDDLIGARRGVINHGVINYGVTNHGVTNHGVTNHGVINQGARRCRMPAACQHRHAGGGARVWVAT